MTQMMIQRLSQSMPRRLLAFALVAATTAAFVGSAQAGRYKVFRGVTFATPQRVELAADIYQPVGEGPFPGVLVVHGGAWAIGTRKQLFHVASELSRAGYVAVSIDYRLAPGYKFPAQLDDCRTGLDWMIEHADRYRIDTSRLAAWGYSAGGHLAALLGAQDQRLKAVVAGGAPCDLTAMAERSHKLDYFLGGTKDEVPERYKQASPVTHVSADDPPMLFYHGQNDLLVPPAQPKAMIDALKKAGVPARLHTVPEVGHVGALLAPSAITAGRRFLDKTLRAEE